MSFSGSRRGAWDGNSEEDREHEERAIKGLEADVVLVCPLDAQAARARRVSSASHFAQRAETASNQAREAVLEKLQAGGLRVTTMQTADARQTLVKITAARSRLIEEAERQKMPKLLREHRDADPRAMQEVAYAEFHSSRIDSFARTGGAE